MFIHTHELAHASQNDGHFGLLAKANKKDVRIALSLLLAILLVLSVVFSHLFAETDKQVEEEDAFADLVSDEEYGLIRVANGIQHNLALDSDGQIYSWGLNTNGELGLGDTEQNGALNNDHFSDRNFSPQKLSDYISLGGIKFKEIAVGDDFSLALSTSGDIYSWGNNENGRLGQSDTVQRSEPAKINLGTLKFKSIKAAAHHAMAISEAGDIYAWGRDLGDGRLGLGTVENDGVLTPTKLELGSLSFKEIEANEYASYALSMDGKAYGTGRNGEGQLGLDNIDESNTMILITDMAFKTIAAGGYSAMGIGLDNEIYSWGRDGGQLGVGDDSRKTDPRYYRNIHRISESSPDIQGVEFEDVWMGIYHSMAVSTDGEIYSWGINTVDGMVGVGISTRYSSGIGNNFMITDEHYTSPRKISDAIPAMEGVNIKALPSSESFHTLVIADNGDIYSWGMNNYGSLGFGDNYDWNWSHQLNTRPRLLGNLLVPKISQVCYKQTGKDEKTIDDKIPTDSDSIKVYFNMPMAEDNLGEAYLLNKDTNERVEILDTAQVWSEDGKTLTLQITGSLENGQEYTLVLDNYEKKGSFKAGVTESYDFEADNKLNTGTSGPGSGGGDASTGSGIENGSTGSGIGSGTGGGITDNGSSNGAIGTNPDTGGNNSGDNGSNTGNNGGNTGSNGDSNNGSNTGNNGGNTGNNGSNTGTGTGSGGSGESDQNNSNNSNNSNNGGNGSGSGTGDSTSNGNGSGNNGSGNTDASLLTDSALSTDSALGGDNANGSGNGSSNGSGTSGTNETKIGNEKEPMAADDNPTLFASVKSAFADNPLLWLLPAGLLLLLTIFIWWWFIILAKRRKEDDDEEEEEAPSLRGNK